jgi:hypothetical protein
MGVLPVSPELILSNQCCDKTSLKTSVAQIPAVWQSQLSKSRNWGFHQKTLTPSSINTQEVGSSGAWRRLRVPPNVPEPHSRRGGTAEEWHLVCHLFSSSYSRNHLYCYPNHPERSAVMSSMGTWAEKTDNKVKVGEGFPTQEWTQNF